MNHKTGLPDQNFEHLLRIQRDLGIALSSTSDLPDALRLILNSLFQTGTADAGCLYVFGKNLTDIALESSQGFSPSLIEAARRDIFDDEIFPRIRDGLPFFGSFDQLTSPYGKLGTGEGFRSFGMIPFRYENTTLGAICIASRSAEQIPPQSILVYETIAARLAGIISRIRNEDSLKKVNRTLEELYEKLKISEQRYRSVVDDLTDLVCRFLPDGVITFVNDAYASYFGGQKENYIGTNYLQSVHEEDKSKALRHISTLVKTSQVGMIDFRVIRSDGTIRWIDWTNKVILSEHGTIIEYQSVGRDITDKKVLQEKLEYLGMHDSLTGLYNRAYFDEEMKRLSTTRTLPVSVVVCDVNGLKIVNDALGHHKGDLLLISAATVLKQCFRETDIIARVGGDEFSVILPNTAEESLLQSLGRIKKLIKETREKNSEIPLSLALGYAVRTQANITLESALSEADDRMYHEKEIQRDFTRGLVLTTLMHEISKVDEYRSTHMLRVRDISLSIGRELGLSAHKLEKLQLASRYHDIGMVNLDIRAMNKNSVFSPDEKEAVNRHSEAGSRIAEAHPFLRDISDVILKHHEWWNGKGYPKRLKGEDIPLLSRIIAVADAYDAMTNNRYYRIPLTREEALEQIRSLSGIQFDPEAVSALLAVS
jgi:diguanylate cyclase (GGDEF)-like protein/PAS domain S-box-containing protein